MKKRFRQADGTEVEVEGSPEELAEYERQIREGQKPVSIGKKKPVLRGAEVDGKLLTDEELSLIRLHRLGLLPKERVVKEKEYVPWYLQPAPYILKDSPLLLDQPCGVCGQYNCRQLHIWCDTITLTSDSTVPKDKAYLITEGQVTGLLKS